MNVYAQKRILVGIDYTKSSENAFNYALMLAEKTKASITLLHVFEFPIIHTNSGLYVIDYKVVKNNDLHKLERLKEKALKKFPKVSIECINTTDNLKSFLKDYVHKNKIDYVVLGLQTKNKISKFIYGSTGLGLSVKINCPVLIVPETYRHHQLMHALITVDNIHSVKKKILEDAFDFTHTYKCNHQLVHVKTEDEFDIVWKKKKAPQNWNIKTIEAKDFSAGINKYIKTNPTDLIILFSHSHSPFYKLFNETNTKHIAFRSKIPVLSIHN